MTWDVRAPATARATRNAEPKSYDFRRPQTLAREQGRVLEMAYETFGRQWGNQLSARLRIPYQVTLDAVSLRSYDEYVRSLPEPTVMVLCNVEQTRQSAVVQLPMQSAMVWIDYLLGGSGRVDPAMAPRDFTEIEQTLVRNLLQSALGDLGYAFSAIMPISVSVKNFQYNPQFVQAVPAADSVIVAEFTLRCGERTHAATLMLPADLVLAALNASEKTDNRTDEERISHDVARGNVNTAVQNAPMAVAVRFMPRTVHPRDVINLAVGDLLPLSHATPKPLEVVVEDVVLAHAAIGSEGSRLAVMVTHVEETTR